jgi:hypothetical protein
MRPYFIAVVGSAAASWPFAACAQQRAMRAVGVLDSGSNLGLVASLARPGWQRHGHHFFIGELAAKRGELLRELTPGAARVAVIDQSHRQHPYGGGRERC